MIAVMPNNCHTVLSQVQKAGGCNACNFHWGKRKSAGKIELNVCACPPPVCVEEIHQYQEIPKIIYYHGIRCAVWLTITLFGFIVLNVTGDGWGWMIYECSGQ